MPNLALRLRFPLLGLACLALAGGPDVPRPNAMTPDPNGVRPISARDSVFVEELTWMEVRDRMKAGTRTVIVATGGVEQNGPYLATGKHNYILRATTEAIARKLGDALVAPIVVFVPEGDFDPPTQHMKYPGTITLSEDTFERLLTDICRSFQVHGFRRIVLIGDSGGNQTGMKKVAAKLTGEWGPTGTQVRFVPEYYEGEPVAKWLAEQGIKQVPEGYHDDFANTAQVMVADPHAVRMQERIAAGKFRINGVDLAPAEKTIAWGKRIVDFRAERTVAAIRQAFGTAAAK